jgi:uncharacterized membrane protein YfcA
MKRKFFKIAMIVFVCFGFISCFVGAYYLFKQEKNIYNILFSISLLFWGVAVFIKIIVIPENLKKITIRKLRK